ncbi:MULTISPECIES: SpoIIIAH-like family protein [unclassified Sporolactobacillus]|uniref:SpoIIIAH-like family protein n=1 Tax=unclassified Sporolactobacillus TaxID=2628533 RepID=UPI002367A379|nr:SpoIIIAH-like family protein [Sporolactobacillus sp. CQH2019]MDD9149297.1 SpoIIIAH-like family protein [Sporolactobacillus sp. CQH2019]
MLKKQTIWLLTMLSLIVVLSVYALTSPSQPSNSASQSSAGSSKASSSKQTTAGKGQPVATVSAADNKLAEIELQKADERNQQEQKYQSVIASGKSSPSEVSAAYDAMQSMSTLSNNEMMLEDVIQAKGFKNAVVKTSGNQIQIFVEQNKLSGQQANTMIRLANQYLGSGKIVSVNYALAQN